MEPRLHVAPLAAGATAPSLVRRPSPSSVRARSSARLLPVFGVVRDQHLADVVGVIDEEGPLAAHSEADDVAVVAREAAEDRQRIAAGHDERADHRELRISGGTAGRVIARSCHARLP